MKHTWAGELTKKSYEDFMGQIDAMTDAQLRWMPYS
jgi:hypothetical protein